MATFPGVDFMDIDSLFSEEELMVRQTVRDFVDEEVLGERHEVALRDRLVAARHDHFLRTALTAPEADHTVNLRHHRRVRERRREDPRARAGPGEVRFNIRNGRLDV